MVTENMPPPPKVTSLGPVEDFSSSMMNLSGGYTLRLLSVHYMPSGLKHSEVALTLTQRKIFYRIKSHGVDHNKG